MRVLVGMGVAGSARSGSGSGVGFESPSHCAALRADRQHARAGVRECSAPAVASARQATAERCPQLALSQHLGRGTRGGGHVARCGVRAVERSWPDVLDGIARCSVRAAERSLPGVVGGARRLALERRQRGSRLSGGGGMLGGHGAQRSVVAKRGCGGARCGLWALPRRGGGKGDPGRRRRRGGRRSFLALIEALVVVGEVVNRSPRGEVDGSGWLATGGWRRPDRRGPHRRGRGHHIPLVLHALCCCSLWGAQRTTLSTVGGQQQRGRLHRLRFSPAAAPLPPLPPPPPGCQKLHR